MFFFSEYNGTQKNSCSHKAHKVPLRVTHKDHKEQPDDLAILCGLCACAALRELCGNRLLFFVAFVGGGRLLTLFHQLHLRVYPDLITYYHTPRFGYRIPG